MFGRGHHAGIPRRPYVSADHLRDLLGVFAEGTRVDDGIGRVRVHVGDGIKVPLHADGARLLGDNLGETFNISRVAGGAKGHGMGKHRGAIQPGGEPPLEVGGKDEGQM